MTTTIKEAEGSLRELTARRDALLEEVAQLERQLRIIEQQLPVRFMDPDKVEKISDRVFEQNEKLFRKLAAC